MHGGNQARSPRVGAFAEDTCLQYGKSEVGGGAEWSCLGGRRVRENLERRGRQAPIDLLQAPAAFHDFRGWRWTGGCQAPEEDAPWGRAPGPASGGDLVANGSRGHPGVVARSIGGGGMACAIRSMRLAWDFEDFGARHSTENRAEDTAGAEGRRGGARDSSAPPGQEGIGGDSGPRVLRRPRPRRATRGYIPSPRWGFATPRWGRADRRKAEAASRRFTAGEARGTLLR